MPIHTILVPTDFSPEADRALEYAIELAQPTRARIHLLHSSYLGPSVEGLPEPLGIPVEFSEQLKREACAKLEELEKRVVQAWLPASSQLSEESPVSAIVDYAKAAPVDLIVMGTRGRTGLSHVLLGSVTERTVRLAPCPVLTVKADSPCCVNESAAQPEAPYAGPCAPSADCCCASLDPGTCGSGPLQVA